MSQFEELVRLREFELDERRRESGDILNEVNMLQDEMTKLDERLKAEQKIASESLEARFIYNEFASGVIRQREWLTAAIRVKEEEYESSREKVAHAYGEMRKAEIVRDEAVKNEKQRAQTLEQIEMDEIAQTIHRRKIE